MRRIIDGILYDTLASEYICSKDYRGNFCGKSRSRYSVNYFIAKDGVIFRVQLSSDNQLVLIDDETELKQIKERMSPKVYKKYFNLIIPGKVKKENKKNKKEKIIRNRLDKIEE